MRTLTIDKKWDDWKFGDTDAIMTFTVADDERTPDFTNKSLTFKIASASDEKADDYVASAPGYVSDKNVILKTADIKDLTPGTYAVELWVLDKDSQKTAIYPSNSFAFFTIDENTMKVSDITNISSKTIKAVWDELVQRMGALKKGEKGEPGATPKLVIGTVTKLASGQQPTVTIVPSSDDPNTYTVNFQIPAGEKGEKGDPGLPGKPGGQGLPGNDGLTPSIDPTSKHWMIGNTDTGVIAEGQPGKDADTSNLVTADSFNILRQDVKNNTDTLKALQDSTKYDDLKDEVDGVKDKITDLDQLKDDVADSMAKEADNATKLANIEKALKALQDAGKDTSNDSQSPKSDEPTDPDEPSSSASAGSSSSSDSTPASSAGSASSDASSASEPDNNQASSASSASAAD